MLHINKLRTTEQSYTNHIYMTHPPSIYVTINNFAFIADKEIDCGNEVWMSKLHRSFMKFAFGDEVEVKPLEPVKRDTPLSITFNIKFNNSKTKEQKVLDYDLIIKSLPLLIPFNNNCTYLIAIDNTYYQITSQFNGTFTFINPAIDVISFVSNDIVIDTGKSAVSLFKSTFNFQTLGVGGLNEELMTMFRRAFASRIIPPKVFKQLGITHVKGIILHGPPGCGKTLMAKQIGKLLDCAEPKIINGPQLLSKFVGESEQNIRNLFDDIRTDYEQKGEYSQLHLIIFDEFDSIAKKRGRGSDNTGTEDRIVNQLLTMIDGVDSPNNFLIIAMTNRIDLIDEALLRPGRFELQIEIKLPDEQGRQEIFAIHTKMLNENKRLSPDVDINELAHATPNFTGAEIAGVVKSAVSFALNKRIDVNDLDNIDVDDLMITRDDFTHALDECKPAFGVEDSLSSMIEYGIIDYNDEIKSIRQSLLDSVNKFKSSKCHSYSILLHGQHGVGKSALAAKTCLDGQFNYVKVISSYDFIGMNDVQISREMMNVFANASKSECSAIIIDDVEMVIKYAEGRGIYSNDILITLKSLLKHNSSFVFITTSKMEILRDIGFGDELFDKVVKISMIHDEMSLKCIDERLKFDGNVSVKDAMIRKMMM